MAWIQPRIGGIRSFNFSISFLSLSSLLISTAGAATQTPCALSSAMRAKGIDLHHSIYRPIFRQLFRMGTSPTGDDASQEQKLETDRASVLRRETSDEQATEMVTSWFVIKMAQVLGLDTSDVDPDKPVHAYGIDSLVAIDLKNWFAREIGAEIQVFFLLGNTPIKEVSREAAVRSTWRPSTTKENN